MSDPVGTDRRTAASRVLDVLGAFGPGHRTLSLSQISRRAGLTLSTTHRLTAELVTWGALERGEDGRYAIGLRLLELSALAPRGLELREAAFKHLEDLHRETRGHVHLGVRDEHEVVYVEALRSREFTPITSRVGDRWPLHATGTGMVLLAFAEPGVQDEVLGRPLARYTARTETDPDRIRHRLQAVRRSGVAVVHGAITEELVAVGVPVRGPDGTVLAALSVVVRDRGPRVSDLAATLTATSARITRALASARADALGPATKVAGVTPLGGTRSPVRPVERPPRGGAGCRPA